MATLSTRGITRVAVCYSIVPTLLTLRATRGSTPTKPLLSTNLRLATSGGPSSPWSRAWD